MLPTSFALLLPKDPRLKPTLRHADFSVSAVIMKGFGQKPGRLRHGNALLLWSTEHVSYMVYPQFFSPLQAGQADDIYF